MILLRLSRFLVFILILIGIATGAGLYGIGRITGGNPWRLSFFEQNKPEIAWEDIPKGIGSEPALIKVKVSDPGSGIDEVAIKLINKGQSIVLDKLTLPPGRFIEKSLETKLDTKALGLREGDIKLSAVAFDRSIWNNSAESTITIPVDYQKPRVEVLTPQQNAMQGGTEIVFYKVLGKKPKESGVRAGTIVYRGYPAVSIDPSFKGYPDLYFALFPVPFEFDEGRDHMRVVAEDEIGNIAVAPFNYRINRRRTGGGEVHIGRDSIVNKINEVSHSAGAPILTGDPIKDFKLLNEQFRAENSRTIEKLLIGAEADCSWQTNFIKPVSAPVKNGFGDRRLLFMDNFPLSGVNSSGLEFSSGNGTQVVTVADGSVVYSGELGVYGNTVIIDHGCGLASVYGWLSSAAIKVGDKVKSGQELGRTGETGLTLGNALLFEMRLHGVPVTPIEWWDSTWIADHLIAKIQSVKKTLIGAPGE